MSSVSLRLSQEAESQRSAPTDTASSDGGSGALDTAAKGPRLSVNEYAAWMGTYPGMDFKLPSSQGASPQSLDLLRQRVHCRRLVLRARMPCFPSSEVLGRIAAARVLTLQVSQGDG